MNTDFLRSFAQKPIDDKLFKRIFGLKPKEAIKALEDKGYEITWSWREQLKLNNAQVFTVAKAMKLDVLQDIRDSLDNALKNGLSFGSFKKELRPVLEAKGWWGKQVLDGEVVQLGSPSRLQTIYRTNMGSVRNVGRWEAFESNKANRPYLMYDAVMDPSTRDEHAALNGVIKHIDDPFWDTWMPPNGYNCRCTVRALTPEQAEERKVVKVPKDIKPDEGFDHNPAKQRWEPEAQDYDKDIAKRGGL